MINDYKVIVKETITREYTVMAESIKEIIDGLPQTQGGKVLELLSHEYISITEV